MPLSWPEIGRVIDRTHRVPDSYRRFTATPALAHRLYRIDGELLGALADGGLRSCGTALGARYDELDLANVAISLRLPAPVFLAMRWWPANLRLISGTSSTYVVGFRSRCSGGNCRTCAKSFAPELSNSGASFTETPGDLLTDASATITTALQPVPLPRQVCDLFAGFDCVEWHLLPAELARDIGFIRAARLADCRLSSYYLYRLAMERGIAARTSFGLFVSVPFSAFHYWTEFRVKDRWLPADPLLIRSLERWKLLQPGEWPETTSPSGVLWRLNSRNVPLAWHDGRPARVTMPTAKVSV